MQLFLKKQGVLSWTRMCCSRRDWKFSNGCCYRYRGLFTPQEAEAMSLVVYWAKEKGFKCCVFETDVKLVTDAANEIVGRSPFHLIISDCTSLSKHFDDVLICYVHRSANDMAHLSLSARFASEVVTKLY